jgi:hypothetical protein
LYKFYNVVFIYTKHKAVIFYSPLYFEFEYYFKILGVPANEQEEEASGSSELVERQRTSVSVLPNCRFTSLSCYDL